MIYLLILLAILIVEIWYFYKNVETNSYWKNVGICMIFSILSSIITSIANNNFATINIISLIISAFLGSMLSVVIFKFAKTNTKSVVGFVIFMLCTEFLIFFVLTLIVGLISRLMIGMLI